MCGIAGAVGAANLDVVPFLKDALCRLEYRGYDSCGLTVFNGTGHVGSRHIGRPSATLREATFPKGFAGIAHTRWASHGPVSLANTHPIRGGKSGATWVVHNGIVENHAALRKTLAASGYAFETDTDTECIAHLLDVALRDRADPFNESLFSALEFVRSLLQGRYCFVALAASAPGVLLCVANGSPLVVCPARGLVASDPVALCGHVTAEDPVYRMRDGHVALLCLEDGVPACHSWPYGWYEADRVTVPESITDLTAPKARGEWLRREIHEQPDLIRRLGADFSVDLQELGVTLWGARQITFCGAGSSYHAALFGDYLFRHGMHARATLPAEAEALDFGTVFVAATQSGETADLVAALRETGQEAPRPIVLTNRPHSTCARLGKVIPLDCGEERSVAATKSFTAQLLRLWQMHDVWQAGPKTTPEEYEAVAQSAEAALALNLTLLQSLCRHSLRVFLAGSGVGHVAALEGALKLKEVAYCNAEAVHIAEIKHGPLALLDEETLVIAIVNESRDLNAVSELLARDVPVVVIVADPLLAQRAQELVGERTLVVPQLPALCEPLQVVPFTIILQRLAYELGMRTDDDPDMPRNLSKSLTVE